MKLGRALLAGEQIRIRAKEIAKEISEMYAERTNPLVCVCVLSGAAMFFCDVFKHISVDARSEFVSVRSYDGTEAREPKLIMDADIQPGSDVMVFEDIVDTGATAEFVKNMLAARGANTVKVCSMLARKPGMADIIGFVIDTDKFFVGYGLDYNHGMRNLDGVYELIP